MTNAVREKVMHWTPTQADFNQFADLSGDHNPIHVDPAAAAATRFGATVAHGMLLYALLDSLARSLLPGAIAVTQQLMFPAPAFAGTPLTFSVRVDRVDGAEAHVSVRCQDPSGSAIACTGTSVYQLPQEPS